jgi:hypothetical protein
MTPSSSGLSSPARSLHHSMLCILPSLSSHLTHTFNLHDSEQFQYLYVRRSTNRHWGGMVPKQGAPSRIFGVDFSRRLVEPSNIYWMYVSHSLSKSMLIDMNHLTQPDVLVVILHYYLQYSVCFWSQHQKTQSDKLSFANSMNSCISLPLQIWGFLLRCGPSPRTSGKAYIAVGGEGKD